MEAERRITEGQGFLACRYFLEQFNEREHSESIQMLIGWMEPEVDGVPYDPAQWEDWVRSVDRALAEKPAE